MLKGRKRRRKKRSIKRIDGRIGRRGVVEGIIIDGIRKVREGMELRDELRGAGREETEGGKIGN